MQTESNWDSFAEQSVIGACLLLPPEEYPPAVRALQPEFFLGENHGLIWMAIQDCLENGVAPDETSVIKKLHEWDHRGKIVIQVCEYPDQVGTTVNLERWANMVLHDGKIAEIKRRLQMGGARASQSDSLPELQSILQDTAKITAAELSSTGLRHVAELLPQVLENIEARRENPNAFRICRTGIRGLDETVELQSGQLTILAGRPGMGKSAMACQIASFVAEAKSTALFSLEMSAASLLRRMSQGGRSLERKLLLVDDRGGLTVPQLSAEVRATRPTLVVVDYLQLLQPVGEFERHDLRVGSLAKGLRSLAKENSCHVLALAQLNRGVESRSDKRPGLSDLRDSGNLEEDADNVWFLYRPGYYDPTGGGAETEIIIAKNRHGETGVVRVAWDGGKQEFRE